MSTSVTFLGFFQHRHLVFSTIRHRHFFDIFKAPPFCVYDNLTRLVSYFRQSDNVIFFVLIQAPPFCVYENLTRLVSYFRLSDTAIFCTNSGTAILCLRQSDTASFFFLATRHRQTEVYYNNMFLKLPANILIK